MALLGRLRNNSWLLIIFIGLGLALFIVTSMFVGNASPFTGSQYSMGKVNGKAVDWQEFNKVENALYANAGGDVYSRRNSLWNYFVEEALVKEEADALGLGVSNQELLDLLYGSDDKLSNIIKTRFRNPQTNQIDREQLNQIRSLIQSGELNPSYVPYWKHQTKEVVKERLQGKLNGMVNKAIYTPAWMIEQANIDQNQKVDFSYVRIPFDDIENSEVSLTDADLNAYLSENNFNYIQDQETRKVKFTVFNVKASKSDSVEIRNEMMEMKPKFIETKGEDIEIFVENNYGAMSPTYFSQDDKDPADRTRTQKVFSDNISDTLFRMAIGSVYGPYIDGDNYVLAKLVDRQIMPDSAKSRHILINAQTESQFVAAEKTIDSLKTLLVNGVHSFDSLAIKFSQDPGSAQKGGEYDFVSPTQFVPEFSDIIFFAGDIGGLYPVRTQYGVHLIEPLARKSETTPRAKVAYVTKPIIPSATTISTKLTEVSKFVQANRSLADLEKSVADNSALEMETSAPLKRNDFVLGSLGTGQSSRDIIRWAFGASKGDVSPDIYRYQDPVNFYDNRFVIASLASIQSAGSVALENVREEIEPFVRNNKKGEMLISKINGSNLSSIASSFQTKVDTAKSVSFVSSYVPGLGNEPKVISNLFALDINAVSKPIIGNDGVYLVQMISKPVVAAPSNTSQLRKQISGKTQSQVNNQLIQAIKKKAEIEDMRSKFY